MNPETGRRLQEASLHSISVVAQPTLKEEQDTTAFSGSLLALCVEKDRGGGVSLACKGLASNNRTFAIYTTAILPRLWRDILHERGNDYYVTRLRNLAEKVLMLLPIYTAFEDLVHTSKDTLESLPASPVLETRQVSGNSLTENKPRFLLNAALHKQHCIVGQGSITETLLAVLRRPWCVLEICVGSTHEEYGDSDQNALDVLADVLSFARLAYEKDEFGYAMAVFLLEHELDKRYAAKTSDFMIATIPRDRKEQFKRKKANSSNFQLDSNNKSLQPYRWPRSSYAYASCSKAVFLPSLNSFNAFWIRLICVSAVESEMSFSALVDMLIAGISGQVGLSESKMPRTTMFSQKGKQTRRLSDSEIHFSRICGDSFQYIYTDNLIEDMLQIYRGVLQKVGDYV